MKLDTILHGDCLELMQTLPDSSVDAIITDPPYFLPAEHYQSRTQWARSLSDLSIIEHFIGSVMSECRRVVKPKGALLIFCDGQSYPVMYARAYRTFDRLTDIVWDKRAIGLGRGVRRRHEMILACVPASFRWQGWIPSVIECPPVRPQLRTHPAEKPVDLLAQLVRLVTKPGEVVLDPFAGTASTLKAAYQEHRHYIGIEREMDYVERARRQLACMQPSLTVAVVARTARRRAAA